MAETSQETGDYIVEFARRYPTVDESELREVIGWGPGEVRLYLEACGVIDDYPRRAPPAAARDHKGEVAE